MNADRWQQISRLYSDALAREGDTRATFLREACGGDEALRQEVESLLAQGTDPSVFLNEPAIVVAADAISEGGSSPIGRRLGVYSVSARIGAGGMGEVYRARDMKLGRDVAMKVLPAFFAADPDFRSSSTGLGS